MSLTVVSIIRGLHDVFAALWAGGLLVLALVVLPVAVKRDGLALARSIQDRLHKFVWVAVIVLTVTGILLARMRANAGSLLAAPGPYQTLFTAKIATVAVMVIVAAVRQYLMFRRNVTGKSPAVLLAVNVVLAIATLMLSASLTVLAGAAQRGGAVL